MAGRVIRILPRTFVTFTGVQNSTTQQLLLARRIDVSQWREITLFVRVHTPSNIGIMTTQPTIQVFQDGWTSEDPAPAATTGGGFFPGLFLQPGPGLTLTGTTSFSQQATTALGFYPMGLPVNSNVGHLIAVGITAKQAAAAVTCDMYLSIDLSGKD